MESLLTAITDNCLIATANNTETWLITNAIMENWLVTVIFSVVTIWILAATAESIMKTAAHERSRREIAAYIAEGSMKPEDGERLLNAGKRKSCP